MKVLCTHIVSRLDYKLLEEWNPCLIPATSRMPRIVLYTRARQIPNECTNYTCTVTQSDSNYDLSCLQQQFP